MSNVGKKERVTQNRLLKLFREGLDYDYLGNWEERPGNSNVEEELLIDWLKRQGHDDKVISKVLYELDKAKALGGSKNLYDANREVYGLLRYGVKVKPEAGEQNVTVWLVDWKNPTKNDFAIAEEVTVAGVHDKRPDLMLYLNGIAVGVIELKRSIISIAEGIRQNLDNQTKAFIRPFYATVQLVMAGNDTEGLRYGVIETPERYYLGWKEDSAIEDLLDRAITQLCNKERLLEVIHDFMVFDAGTKKTCRHSQYFGVHAAQQAIKKREGGIIWHTQGSGKSLTMVWLAKWIREHVENARVLLITDRTDLDEQIEKVFKGVDEDIYRTKSGKDLIDVLNKSDEWLVCSLIHKFGASDEIDIKSYIKEIQQYLPKGFQAKGDIFVFVDECHRTHTGVWRYSVPTFTHTSTTKRCATESCSTCATKLVTSTSTSRIRQRSMPGSMQKLAP
jgi:type I restriction enzyme R subunit